MPDGYDVFLSHNSRDKPVVEKIAALLKGQGLTAWLDKWELRPGFPWQEGLEDGIQAARAGAVFVGKEGIGSWQEPEMRAFIARSRRERIPVIPVLLPGCPETPQLTAFLEAFTWVDLRKGLNKDGLARLVWGITGKKPEGNSTDVASAPSRVKASVQRSPAKSQVLLVARDLQDHPLAGFRFSYGGVVSRATNQAGATQLDLPPGYGPGQQIKILLVKSATDAEDWFLVNPQVNIPISSASAELVLMRRNDFRQIVAEARAWSGMTALWSEKQPTSESPRSRLIEVAARRGLTVEQLDTALQSFGETQDPEDRRIAAYLEEKYLQAEELKKDAAAKKERGLGKALLYLSRAPMRAGAIFRTRFSKLWSWRRQEPVASAEISSMLGSTTWKRWNWGIAISLLGLVATLAAWLWPFSSATPPQPIKPGLYAVRVQVFDPQGHPVEGAKVRTSAGNEPQLLSDGWWEVEIPAVKVPKDGRISLWADHQDWAGNRTDLTLGDDPNPRAEIHLKEPESLVRGRVEGTRALAGLHISRSDGAPGDATTEADGRFELKLSEPEGKKVRLRATRAGAEVGNTFCYTGTDNCTISLEKP